MKPASLNFYRVWLIIAAVATAAFLLSNLSWSRYDSNNDIDVSSLIQKDENTVNLDGYTKADKVDTNNGIIKIYASEAAKPAAITAAHEGLSLSDYIAAQSYEVQPSERWINIFKPVLGPVYFYKPLTWLDERAFEDTNQRR